MIIVAIVCDNCGRQYSHREFKEEIIDDLLDAIETRGINKDLCNDCSLKISKDRPMWEDITLAEGIDIRLCRAPSMKSMAFECSKSVFEKDADICKYYCDREIGDTEFGLCLFEDE